MDVNSLQRQLERPEVHRKILAGYSGAYSLGVGEDPKSSTLALILQVEGTELGSFPAKISLDGEEVMLIVRSGFRSPSPLARPTSGVGPQRLRVGIRNLV